MAVDSAKRLGSPINSPNQVVAARLAEFAMWDMINAPRLGAEPQNGELTGRRVVPNVPVEGAELHRGTFATGDVINVPR